MKCPINDSSTQCKNFLRKNIIRGKFLDFRLCVLEVWCGNTVIQFFSWLLNFLIWFHSVLSTAIHFSWIVELTEMYFKMDIFGNLFSRINPCENKLLAKINWFTMSMCRGCIGVEVCLPSFCIYAPFLFPHHENMSV